MRHIQIHHNGLADCRLQFLHLHCDCWHLLSHIVRVFIIYNRIHISPEQKAVSHLGDCRVLLRNINGLKPLIDLSFPGVEMVPFEVVETADTVCSGHGHYPGEVREVHPVLALLAPGDDGEEVIAPHDLPRDEGGAHLARGAGGLRCAIQKHHQLKLLPVQGVHGHLEEGAVPVDHVVEREGTHEEQVVLPSFHREVDVHLVHDDGLPVCRVGCPQQLAVDLAPDHQSFPHVGHTDGEAQGALLGTNDGHFAEGDGLGSLFRHGDFGQDDAAHETVDDGSDQGLDDD